MNSAEGSSTLEDIENSFTKKVSLIEELSELEYMDLQDARFFNDLGNHLINLEGLFKQIRKELNEGHNQLADLKCFMQTMESLNDRLDHMEKNFPVVLKPQVEASQKCFREKAEVSYAPVVLKKTKTPAKIKSLTVAEFEALPRYMRGRLQYAQINSFIDSFNKTITSRYQLLSAPRKTLKPADYKICTVMKSQENEETKGKYFCTADDLKVYGNVKMDKVTDSILTILRHSKRMKEVRGPGSFKRYLITE